MKNVVIVESPSKSKTIESYMGENFKVLSSVGHIRDLATSGHDGLGIDIEKGFQPNYIIIKGKEKIVSDLKKACKGANVYLATDPDREGEAISYHLANVLDLDIENVKRVEFHEITKNTIIKAFESPRKIDLNLVYSQETRRMLDRIIGFKISKLLKSKIKSQSAGRVQSVALKLVVDLEKEIKNFISTPYYEIEALFDGFKLELESYKDDKKRIVDKKLGLDIINSLDKDFIVLNIESKEQKRESKPPFTTSTLQQDASNKLGFSSSKTMRIAQALYEGKKIGDVEMGLITYMRTDSTHLSDVFKNEAFDYIKKNYGEKYVGKVKEKTQALAQQAHEAIRPTSLLHNPDMIKRYLTNDEYKLYKLIYNRAVTSLMSPSLFERKKVIFKNNDALFKINGQTMLFDGYLKAYGIEEEDKNKELPNFKIGESYKANDVILNELFTKPKSRYTEATLIKDMEELGIGRPSTYAQTMTTLKDREYIVMEEKKIVPTEQGILTSEKLDEFFDSIINVEYTANMEGMLDKVAKGEANSKEELKKFYDEFLPVYENATLNMEAIYPKSTGEYCPECNNELVIRKGRYGEFTACSNYPKCKYIKQEETSQDIDTLVKCDACGKGTFIKKITRKGKNQGTFFYACSNFPKCKTIYNDEPTDKLCPKCNSIMLLNDKNELYCSKKCDEQDDYEKVLCPKCNKGHLIKRLATKGKNKGNYFYACDNFPKCKIIFNLMPINQKCDLCGNIMLMDEGKLVCSNSECKKSQ